MEKKDEIIQTAVCFFAEKGYFSTSMQEIAKDCGVSKGTLYNFFVSKEDLLIQVIDYSLKKMLEHIRTVDFDSSLSPKERLIKKIVMQFDLVVKNKSFITMLIGTFSPGSNPQVTQLVNKIYITMTNWYKKAISEAFGREADPYIWDFTLFLQGIVKEYTVLAIQGDKEIDSEEAARFIVERLEIIIRYTKDVSPILTPEDMAEYGAFEDDAQLGSPQEQIQQYVDNLERNLKRSSLPRQMRDESLAAVQALREELAGQEPRRFMVQSLLLYLSDIEECEYFVERIQMILKAAYP